MNECVINPYESEIVKEIFTKYSQGYKARAIVETLNNKGYRRKDGALISEHNVYYILRNKRYTGVVEHHGVIYDNIFPRIISDELWKSVNVITEENKIAPSRKKEIFNFLLSGKLVCGNCKNRMAGTSATSKTKKIHYYYDCQSQKRTKVKCPTKLIRKQYLEDIVINTTQQLLKPLTNLKSIADEIFLLHKEETKNDTVLKSLEQKRKDALKKQNNIIKAIEEGIITDSTKNRLTELESELLSLEFEIEKEKSHNYSLITLEQIETYLKNYVFDDASDVNVRKLIINTFIREVILYDDKIVITYNFINNPEHLKINKDKVIKEEKQLKQAQFFNFNTSSGILKLSPPIRQKAHF